MLHMSEGRKAIQFQSDCLKNNMTPDSTLFADQHWTLITLSGFNHILVSCRANKDFRRSETLSNSVRRIFNSVCNTITTWVFVGCITVLQVTLPIVSGSFPNDDVSSDGMHYIWRVFDVSVSWPYILTVHL